MVGKNKTWSKILSIFIDEPIKQVEPIANHSNRNHILSFSYSGEKNLGEMGPVINYELDYDLLRYRSWQSQLESDVCKTIINRYVTWIIGNGLKLQCEPEENILKSEGFTINRHAFSTMVESRYRLIKKSLKSDFSQMQTLDRLAAEIKKNAIVGGDVLVIQRFDGKNVNVQVIDGCHVASPALGTEQHNLILQNGNRLINGVELDAKGTHIAYHVRVDSGSHIDKFERVECRNKQSGLQAAFLVYGSKHRLNNVRGLPLLAACLETAKKMERYKEATLGSAEEVAKIVYQVVHQVYSDGTNPMMDRMAQVSGFSSDKPEITLDALGQQVADKVAATTNKTALNMPKGAELKSLEHKSPMQFKDFYSVNTKLLCATISIPYAVAMSDYDGSYSSSRAAIKDWEHTLNVERDFFGEDFYQKNYEFWLDIQILQGKIQAPGYLLAKQKEDEIVLLAYRNTRWVGAQVPHIDPVKEVQAERLKLGESAKSIPLTTVESATERLGCGESNSNMEQFSKEMELAKTYKIGVSNPVN